jgi:hypothetical protein
MSTATKKVIILASIVAGAGLVLWFRRSKKPVVESDVKWIFRGNLVHCLNVSEEGFKVLDDYLIGVNKDGIIIFIEAGLRQTELAQKYGFEETSIVSLGNRLQEILLPITF